MEVACREDEDENPRDAKWKIRKPNQTKSDRLGKVRREWEEGKDSATCEQGDGGKGGTECNAKQNIKIREKNVSDQHQYRPWRE